MKIRDRIKELRRVPACDLIPNPRNWRTHGKAQAEALQGLLAEVGFAGAVLARETPEGLMLIDGHLRSETAGVGIIPVLVLDVTESEADKILATYDPIGAMADSDAEKLDSLLRDVQTGNQALATMLAELAEAAGVIPKEENDPIGEDEVPEPPVDPITKPGDLWILGEHRVLCGDSTKAEDVKRLMGGKKADLCFTSPPYGQQRDYTEEGKAKVADWDGLMRGVFANLPMTDSGQVLVNLGLIHRDGEWIPYWDSWIEWMREQGWRRFGWYVWDQGFGLPGDRNGRFAPSHEFVWHFNRVSIEPEKFIDKKPENVKARHKGGSTMRGKDGKCVDFTSPESSAQPNKIPDSVLRINRVHGGHGIDHPAIFPVELPAFAMQAWPGVAYEPFCGSGTTLIAAEQLGRKCYGMEISPAYCDVIIKRWETLTGKKAILSK